MSEMFVRERLKTSPSEEATALLFGPDLRRATRDFPDMLRVHKAHTVMLVRQDIITREVGASLVGAIEDLQRCGPEELQFDPRLEDLFYNVEGVLIARLGARVAGQLHTGRSRNDLSATMHRMYTRGLVLDVCDQANQLREAMLRVAGEHTRTVMPGYTHLKPAQPITFGYYLCAIASALERDTRRVARAYETTNLNPLGAAALAGTSFPVDRDLTARLLGFDGLIENCLDAVASRDYVLEFISALALLVTTVSRAATDMYVWQSDEFGMIELSDAIAGTSSIMPQKKNPVPLEQARGRAAQVYGALVASFAAIKNTIFSNSGESGSAATQQLDMAVTEALAAVRLLKMIVNNVSVNSDLMLARAAEDFSAVTELADNIVRCCGISFREAHAVVGGTVQRLVVSGNGASDITLAALNEEARAVIGRDLDMTEDLVRASLDPVASVSGKLTVGGPSPAEVERQVAEGLRRTTSDQAEVEKRRDRLVRADALLDQMAGELVPG